MKTILFLLFLVVYAGCDAQQQKTVINADTFRVEKSAALNKQPYETIRTYINIPEKYTIQSYVVTLRNKNEIFKAEAKGELISSNVRPFLTNKKAGAVITVDAIVIKDGNQIHWMPKTWTVQ